MPKFLFVAVNASYSHTNLAVREITQYINISSSDCFFAEFTINQPYGEILRGIAGYKPDFVMFSTYIWNAEMITKIIPDIKKILPDALVGAGGPEFGYAADVYFKKLPQLDFVIKGEGEAVCKWIVESGGISDGELSEDSCTGGGELLVSEGGKVRTVKKFPLIDDLSELPFAYPEIKPEEKENKIFYYESSRGCPFSCSYCMSSLDKRVRYMPLERVFADLQRFLDAEVRLVKFVDRTYNLVPERYIEIWRYILEHHNKKTMFHFEIEAEYLSEEAIEFLQKVPSGVMQFEIGVQSANKKTLNSISRSDNIEKLAKNIRRLPRTIHQHLDLIAGLPYENLESFGKSFDFVMSLKPDALQLGFLKVLHGTSMEQYAKQNGWKWMENPVYETFSTPYMSYEDMLFLKDVEVLVDAYYNSGVFKSVMAFVERNIGFWKFFCRVAEEARKEKVFDAARRETFWFELMAKLINKDLWGVAGQEGNSGALLEGGAENAAGGWSEGEASPVLYDLLRYDFVSRGKQGGFPDWYVHIYDKDRHRQLLEENGGVTNARLDFAHSEYELFFCNPKASVPEETEGEKTEVLLRY